VVSEVTNAIIYTSILDNFVSSLLAHQLFSTAHATSLAHGVRAFAFHATSRDTLQVVREVKQRAFILRFDGQRHRRVVASGSHQHKDHQDEGADERQGVTVRLVEVEHFLIL
jgi:hypothetical protein